MVYIAYHTDLSLQICNYAQKRRICREHIKYALDENFYGYFCHRRKAANFFHPGQMARCLRVWNNSRSCMQIEPQEFYGKRSLEVEDLRSFFGIKKQSLQETGLGDTPLIALTTGASATL